jgi:glycosyltransferase involved in cell wall biosynthesis
MKIVHSLGWYFPENCGGTEVYVDALARGLASQGIQSIIAAARDGLQEDHYAHHGIEVYRYPVMPASSLKEKRGVVPRAGFESFAAWLEKQGADLYHQHSWTPGCGLHHLRQAKKLGLPTVLTVHLPGNICLSETMLRDGKTVCDGKIDIRRCGSCWARHSGAPAWLAAAVGRIPRAASEKAGALLPASRVATMLSIPSLIGEHQRRLIEVTTLADRVVAPCQWLYDALLVNGADPSKMMMSRQGVSQEFPPQPARHQDAGSPLQIGFFGRWSALKGIDILMEAVKRLPASVPIHLALYALAPGRDEKALRQKILSTIKGETRITVEEPLLHEQMPMALAAYDFIVVPSTCLETGPLVVLEALAAGVPVMGSDLGGVAELIQHGKNGWLVPAGDVRAWTAALRHFAERPELVHRLRQSIAPMRTMDTVAVEMAAIYRSLIGR